MSPVLSIKRLSLSQSGGFALREISLSVDEGTCWAIRGGAGSGKSTLLSCIHRYRYYPDVIHFFPDAMPQVALIGHQHRFKNHQGLQNFYYQQRFNASESDTTKTVLDELLKSGGEMDEALAALETLRIGHLKDTPLLQLSNGEHKRFQIAEALFQRAAWLLLDDPFTGLDRKACHLLEDIFQQLTDTGIRLLLVTKDHIPAFITHVAFLESGRLVKTSTAEDARKDVAAETENNEMFVLPEEFAHPFDSEFEYAVRMENVHVKYDEREILSEVSWKVKKGDRWNLSGPNGSGKSTLLSLVTGDNPQAFANDIYLFDRKRGSGESIWDIKKKIGYISPELHYYFDRSFSCFSTVASGLFDTIGLFRKLNDDQTTRVQKWIDFFKIADIARQPLSSLSHGMQRWVLLARALVKNPPLLILDEPCQGIDLNMQNRFLNLVNLLCMAEDRTLIYVTHVDGEIPECVSQYISLENGRIKELIYNGKEHYRNSWRRDRAGSYERSY